MRLDALTIDNLFEPDDSRNSAMHLSGEYILRPNHYKYGLYLEISNYEVRKGAANIRKISDSVSWLFSNHSDIEVCSEPEFHTQHIEEPYRRVFVYPFENIPEFIDGALFIRFNSNFRDAYALCRFLAKLSNAINHLNVSFIWAAYKPDSDEEIWRHRTTIFDTLNYIRKSFNHRVIHINTDGPEKAYLNVYQNMNALCGFLFKDKLQNYRCLKRVFEDTETPYYYSNNKRCAAELIHKEDYQLSELFTVGLDKLPDADIDFSDVVRFDTSTISFSVCAAVDGHDSEVWPAYSKKMKYVISTLTEGTMRGHISNIHVYRCDDTYVLSGSVGAFIDNDYYQTLNYLIVSISGQVRRKSCSFAKNLNNIFGEDCEAAISQYIRWLHKKK